MFSSVPTVPLPYFQIRSHTVAGCLFHQGDHCRRSKNFQHTASHCRSCIFMYYFYAFFSFYSYFQHVLYLPLTLFLTKRLVIAQTILAQEMTEPNRVLVFFILIFLLLLFQLFLFSYFRSASSSWRSFLLILSVFHHSLIPGSQIFPFALINGHGVGHNISASRLADIQKAVLVSSTPASFVPCISSPVSKFPAMRQSRPILLWLFSCPVFQRNTPLCLSGFFCNASSLV